MTPSEPPTPGAGAAPHRRSRAHLRAQRAAELRYWDFFINSTPIDPMNSLVSGIRSAPQGSINSVRSDLHTPEITTEHVKEIAYRYGAVLAGVVGLAETKQGSAPEDATFAVVSVVEAENDPETSPGIGGQVPVQNGLFVSFVLAAFFRESGFFATMEQRPATELALLASRAGLGTLDGSGRLLTKDYGTKVWVADVVYTDFPLVAGGLAMETYVITEACIGVKDGSCVDVCPVACIHTTADSPQYYIDPKICIECEQCVIVCPVDAIYLDTDVPEQFAHYVEINAQFFAQLERPTESVSLALATPMAAAAEAYAMKVGISLSIAVVDRHGEVVALRQMAGSGPEAREAALSNARRAVETAVPSPGANPILHRLDLVGGVGVSGGSQDENSLASRAAIAAADDAPGGPLS